MKVNVYLKKCGEVICYGQLGKLFRSDDRKHLSLKEKTQVVVKELNNLLPASCVKQQTMFYFIKEE